jgi:hypothetical protein
MDTPTNTFRRIDDTCAVLEGGPADLPPELRVLRTQPTGRTYKLPYRGGYEHFELVNEDSGDVLVFRWAMRTKIAE